MKYSTVIVAAFAAGAMARAIPEEVTELTTGPIITVPTVPETEEYKKKQQEEEYKKKNQDEEYKKKNEDEEYKKKNEDEEYKKKQDEEYKKKNENEEYKKGGDKNKDHKGDNEKEHKPTYKINKPDPKENKYVEKKTFEKNKESKHYAPTPYDDNEDEYKKYEEKSCFDELKWKKDVYADDDCDVEYKPKDKSYNKPVKVYVYGSDDYSKPIEECGEDKENTGKVHWKPKKDWIPSDCKDKGRMYRFKICKADNEDDYTWSEEFPVYNPYYYAEKPEAKPEPAKCPPPTVPVVPVEVPVKEETPVAPETPECTEDCPTPEAPVAPETPATDSPAVPAADSPVYPAPACTDNCPTADVPTIASNTTDDSAITPFTSGSSAVKTSISFMVGIAALVTFAL